MVSLAKTAEEAKKEMPGMPAAVSVMAEPRGPQYPYGCCISLDDDTLEKLDMGDEMPPVGATIHFCCAAKVTNVSMREEAGPDGKPQKCCRVELQITDMGAPGAPDEPRSKKWYGNGEAAEAGADEV
jgi:hypothetical protein